MIYFTADLHLGHKNVIKHCNRPFSSVDEMDKALIRNWNSVVKPKDEVYILGDLTMCPAAKAHEYITQLNGRKYLISGNHDKFLKNYGPYMADFEWVKDYHVLKVNANRLVLFHFPILEWDQFFRDAIHLYGHVHNSAKSAERLGLLDNGLAFNVGVDVNGFAPVSLLEIIQRAESLMSRGN